MKAMPTLEKSEQRRPYSRDTIIHFEEGLIGFSDCKNFVLMENDDIVPFRMLQSADRPDIGFLVLDPTIVQRDFQDYIPAREWESLGLQDGEGHLTFVICIIGPTPGESSGNFQAPLIVNYKTMAGRQIILTDSGLSVRQTLM
jgi:flagellar assembly factor FliW